MKHTLSSGFALAVGPIASTAMKIDPDSKCGSHSFPHCCDARDCLVYFIITIYILQFLRSIHFHRKETLFSHFLCGQPYFRRAVATASPEGPPTLAGAVPSRARKSATMKPLMPLDST